MTPDEFFEKWRKARDEHMQHYGMMRCEPCPEHASLGSAACRACRWRSDDPRPTTAPASDEPPIGRT